MSHTRISVIHFKYFLYVLVLNGRMENGFWLEKLFKKTQNGRFIDDEHFICLSIAIEMSIFFVVHNCFLLQWRIFLFIALRSLYANLRICQECWDAGRLKKCHSRRRKDKKAQEAE